MTDLVDAPVQTVRIGRTRTTHSPKFLIEDKRVVRYTRCGLPLSGRETTETFGYLTCGPCQTHWDAGTWTERAA